MNKDLIHEWVFRILALGIGFGIVLTTPVIIGIPTIYMIAMQIVTGIVLTALWLFLFNELTSTFILVCRYIFYSIEIIEFNNNTNKKTWCKLHLGVCWFTIHNHYFFVFKRDAMAFKLRWI